MLLLLLVYRDDYHRNGLLMAFRIHPFLFRLVFISAPSYIVCVFTIYACVCVSVYLSTSLHGLATLRLCPLQMLPFRVALDCRWGFSFFFLFLADFFFCTSFQLVSLSLSLFFGRSYIKADPPFFMQHYIKTKQKYGERQNF